MDFCRNLSVSGGLPTEYPSEQVISPAYSNKHNGNNYSLDDLFPIQNTEGDVSLEWLSAFVEDCLSSTGNCIPVPTIHTQTNPTTIAAAAATVTAEIPEAPKASNEIEKPHRNQPSSLHEFSIPGKARSKRKRSPTTTIPSLTTFSHLHSKAQGYHVTASDPPLLHQAYWLADSELIVPKKMNNISGGGGGDGDEEEVVMMMMGRGHHNINNNNNKDKLGGSSSSSSSMESSHGQPRRCTHCLSQRTPQWRAGPLGPKTLCNACGVRYKSGRLLPEYRPAKSPTFVSYKHSNSHKKVLEMRMSISSSDE